MCRSLHDKELTAPITFDQWLLLLDKLASTLEVCAQQQQFARPDELLQKKIGIHTYIDARTMGAWRGPDKRQIFVLNIKLIFS